MDSNEHSAMEQNEEHLETNISIYYTHETELYAGSYDAMNRSIYCKVLGTWRKTGRRRSQPPLPDPDRIGAQLVVRRARWPELAPELGERSVTPPI